MAAGDTTTELHHRWTPVNRHKNAPVTIVLNCGWNGERFAVPPQHVPTDSEEALIGSTTLHDLIKRVKSQIPTLYLMLEEGGAVLSCGLNEVHSSEWKTTMLCQLVSILNFAWVWFICINSSELRLAITHVLHNQISTIVLHRFTVKMTPAPPRALN